MFDHFRQASVVIHASPPASDASLVPTGNCPMYRRSRRGEFPPCPDFLYFLPPRTVF